MKFATKAIHAGISPDPSTGAIMTPIFQTSTYVQESPGVHKGYEYARTQNPTRHVLQENIAALENGKFGFCFSTGMGAIDAIVKTLKPGDEVISTNDLYGGTYRLFTKVFQQYGIRFHFTDLSNSANLTALLNDKTRMLWIETPTNPMLNIVDIEVLANIAHNYSPNINVVVDNTFATPYLQNPLNLGANTVTHSATKYLGGHSDVVLGVVVCNDAALAEKLGFIQNSTGATPGPFDCFLVLRGIKTLHIRMEAHCKNAAEIANFLASHKAVKKVNYPGFASHPMHAVAAKQMRGFGGMVSFSLKEDSIQAANKVLSATHLFSLAESLGGVESLIGHPATMTHASIPLEERLKTGVTDSLIRLSVGIEDVSDLIEDLARALG
ncbi:MAG: cystathionine gamma-synthase [Chitinophagales bacterium]|nr:cystathionine gamma-synthase [Bacteroidota bacterium]MCB9043653.1 cystathionine gamma-synthase [Chitinophagales bacterium]